MKINMMKPMLRFSTPLVTAVIVGLAASSRAENPADTRRDDIDWIHDVVMNLCPARTLTKTWDDDEKRLKLFRDFDPDVIDFWGGLTMNAGDILRNRGVAITAQQATEFDAHILGTAAHWELFYENGISVREDGRLGRYPDEIYAGEYGANPASERWNHMLSQHLFRMTDYADAYFQDNICNGLSVLGMGFEDSLNAQFVAHLKEHFSGDKLRALGLETLDDFHIRDAIAAARKRLDVPYHVSGTAPREAAERLIRDPLIHEFIRFSTMRQIAVWRILAENGRAYSMDKGRPVSAYLGNQAGISGKRVLATLQSQSSDIVWIEAAVMLQPCYSGARQAESSMTLKVADASGLYKKPLRILHYPDARYSEDVRMPFLLYGAEAYANGAAPVWGYSFSLHNKGDLESPVYHLMKDFADFVNARRELFVDRERVADTAVVLGLPSLFWRQFSSLSTQTMHLKHFSGAARLLEDQHRPWEALLFGYPGVFDDAEGLARLGQYRSVILPGVDAVSDTQLAALENFVRKGGNLILWGDCGENDEQLMPRSGNAFEPLIANPGKGRVVRITEAEATAYFEVVTSPVVMGQKTPTPWLYTFEKPPASWTDPDFDDSTWREAVTPFGSRERYGDKAATDWPGNALWMRKEIELTEIPHEPVIQFSQQGVLVVWVGAEREVPGDGLEVFINGVFAGSSKTRWSGIHVLPVSAEARKALVKGRNVIAVRSQQSNKPRQFLDIGLAGFAPSDDLAAKVAPGDSMLETEGLSRDVWVNVFRHGNGPMHSVQFVNYALDFKGDRSIPQGAFTVRLRPGAEISQNITSASWEQLGSKPVEIPLRRGEDGSLELQIPGLDTWGILILHAKDERDARSLAADVRKWRNRLNLASRNHVEISSEISPLIRQADALAYPPEAPDYSSYKARAAALKVDLKSRMADLTAQLEARSPVQPSGWMKAKAVRKFDFGKAGAEPGWTEVTAGMRYFTKRGFGWTGRLNQIEETDQGGPDKLLRDFISPVPPSKSLTPLSINHNRYFPLAYPLKRPATFRVDLPNGDYVAALVTGSKEAVGLLSDEVGVATTLVDVNGHAALSGVPLRSGFWVTRAFPFQVTDGSAEFRFHGSFMGPYFHNSTEWLISAMAIFTAADAPQDLREQLAAREKNRSGLIRDWHLIGPFPDPLWNGLDVSFPAECPIDLQAEYRGWRNAGAPVRWMEYHANHPLGTVSLHDFFDEREGRGSAAHGAAALARTRIWSPADSGAQLYGSFSGRGSITLNGQVIHREPAVLGLQDETFRVPVSLRKGWNEVLAKSIHCWGGAWNFHLGVLGNDGQPLPPAP